MATSHIVTLHHAPEFRPRKIVIDRILRVSRVFDFHVTFW